MSTSTLQTSLRRLVMLLHPFGLVYQVIVYKIFKRIPIKKYWISTFLLLGGKPGSVLSRIVGQRPVKFSNLPSESLINPSVLIDAEQLKNKGFFMATSAISSEIIDNLVKLSTTTRGSARATDLGIGYQENIFFDRNNPKVVRFDVDQDSLFTNHIVQDLSCDPKILSIAQNYLGSAPVLDFVAMWWHVKSDRPDKEAAQYFHFDLDRLRWIKFFFYLTNVTELSGPHIFVPGSHKDNGLPFKLRAKGYTRLDDEMVEKVFPKNSWKEFIGPAGSMIVEDTRGLHKGKHVQSGDRLVFQLQYSSCLFGAKVPTIKLKEQNIGLKLKVSMKKYPKVYENIQVV